MPLTGIAKRSSTSPETDLDMELSLFRDIIANNTSVDLRLSINDFSYLVLKTFPWFEAVLFSCMLLVSDSLSGEPGRGIN